MSILGSMYSGISGLNANSSAMAVVGNNISNINTTAFKGNRAEFADILSGSLESGAFSGGTKMSSVQTLFTQGGFKSTGVVTDMAIEGDGFFMVRDAANQNGVCYTRAGNFHLDEGGNLVNAAGYQVQGYTLDQSGNPSSVLSDIQITNTQLPPSQTTSATFHVNLSTDITPITTAFDPTDADTLTASSHYSTAVTVYDSLGNSHQVTAYFTCRDLDPTTGSTWDFNVVVPGEEWNGGTAGQYYVGGTGTLNFNTSGELTAETTTSSSFDFAGGAGLGQAISFDFGTSIAEGGTGLDGSTQFGETSSTLYQTQDGYGPSFIESLAVDEDGKIYGNYGNGQVRYFYQVALARFTNVGGLKHEGGNLYSVTADSGDPMVGAANDGGTGRVYGGSLEQSNIDLAVEFVNMIITQRGFQANSRAITTSDEMIGELANIVR